MMLTDETLGAILTELSYASAEEVRSALEESRQRGVSLKSALTDRGLINESLYESAIAEHYKLPFADLQKTPPNAESVALLPEEIARSFSAVVVERAANAVTVATADPGNTLLEEAIRLNLGQKCAQFPEEEKDGVKRTAAPKPASGHSLFGRKEVVREKFTGEIRMVYAPHAVIENLFVHYRKPLATRFQAIINEQKKVAPEIISEIFNDAIELRASDIHFEPQEKEVMVRFRVDGVMHEAGRIPKEYYEGVVNRIKIEANMQTDEHFAAQDGAIRYETKSGSTMDIRVSIVPIVDGEKIVLRLLAEYVRALTLADLGFSA